jgi:hypothetical protein
MPRKGDGRLDGFQLWVNLPAKQKMSRPRYQEFDASHIPEVRRNDGTTVKVIAGESDGVRGPVREIAMQPTYLDVHLAPGARFEQPIPQGHSAFAYLYKGAAKLGIDATGNGTDMIGPKLAILSDGDAFVAQAGDAGAQFLLVSGAPTKEPIARYGPFVMNTRAEIAQAVNDLNNGTFVWREGRG